MDSKSVLARAIRVADSLAPARRESGPLSVSHRPSGGSLPGTGSATVAEAERGGLPRPQHSSYVTVVLRSIDKVLSSIDVVL